MKLLSMLKRVAALGLLSATVAGLSGCGGGGHSGGSSGQTPSQKVTTAFKTGNFAGTFDSTQNLRSRAGTKPSACTIQFSNSSGVASFASGTAGTSTFRTFSADITNIDFQLGTASSSGVSGTITFDMVNFTTNDFFAGTIHYAGTYSVNSTNFQLQTSGTLTGKDPSGAAVSFGFGINYLPLLEKTDLSGAYTGTIETPNLDGTSSSKTWTGSLTKTDDLHLAASVVTSLGTISFTGQNARTSFAGSFDAGQINPLLTGNFGQWYVETHDSGKTLVGAYVVVDSLGAPVLNPLTQAAIFGNITAKKGTSGGGGGGTAALKTGYYDGGIKRNGSLDGRIIRLDITKVSSTVGNNGGMVIVTGNGGGPNIGGRVASVAASTITNSDGSTTAVSVVTIDQVSNTYSKIVLTGPVSGSAYNATYVATKLDGSTETGSFDQLGSGSTTTTSLTATWSGTATSTVNGKTNAFAATFKSNGDGTVLITPTSTIGGGTEPTITIPAFTAYQAGSSFAGHVNGTVNVSSLGTTFQVTIIGDFDGDANNKSISGDYDYGVFLPGNTTAILSDSGTLALTKP